MLELEIGIKCQMLFQTPHRTGFGTVHRLSAFFSQDQWFSTFQPSKSQNCLRALPYV